jgi:hypothetical protein
MIMDKNVVLIKWWNSPDVIRIQWGSKVYDYYLTSIEDMNKFFYIKTKAGINKASAWLKKQAYKTESVNMDKMATDCTIENFRTLLSKTGWRETDTTAKEFVFEFPMSTNPDVVIKVYSSVHKDTGERREKGKDAIRVFAINLKLKKPLTKTKRVYRTINWRDNVQRVVKETFEVTKERMNWNINK